MGKHHRPQSGAGGIHRVAGEDCRPCQTRFKGRAKHVAVGLLAGVILGLLVGVLVSEFMFERAVDLAGFDHDDPFFGKRTAAIRVSYRTYSLIIGPTLGAIAGVGIGFLYSDELNQLRTVKPTHES